VKTRLLSVDQLEAFWAHLRAGGYEPGYVAGVGRTVRAVLRWAARPVAGRDPVRLIPANPFEGYRFPRALKSVQG